MPLLKERLPEFVAELSAALIADNLHDLAIQLNHVEFKHWSFDTTCSAGYIDVSSPIELNPVDSNIVGVHHGETIVVEHRYGTNIDLDNFGRITGIEFLSGAELAKQLSSAPAP
jgi:hypothetical protein